MLMKKEFAKFQMSKEEMMRISGGDPTIYEYTCRCKFTNTMFQFYVEMKDQLKEAAELCDGNVTCSYVGQH